MFTYQYLYNYLDQMYPAEIEIKDMTENKHYVTYLD